MFRKISVVLVMVTMVIISCDDPGCHSSQNEQDNRYYARAAKLIMVEPSDSQEAKDFVKYGYELSEKYDTPVIVRTTTKLAHSQSAVELCDRVEVEDKTYERDPKKYVMMPAMAIGKHVKVEQRHLALVAYAETSALNEVEDNGSRIGVIVSGTTHLYAHEALGNAVNYLKLGMVYPLPEQKIRDFAASVDTLWVIEELDPFIENHCKALGLAVEGKSVFPICGEFSQRMIAEKLGKEIQRIIYRNR